MKILVWGTGRLVGKVVGRWVALEDVTAFIDNNPNMTEYMGKSVIRPDQISQMEYDAIVVANLFSDEISRQCQSLDGVDTSKIIYLYNNCKVVDMNQNYNFVQEILGGIRRCG